MTKNAIIAIAVSALACGAWVSTASAAQTNPKHHRHAHAKLQAPISVAGSTDLATIGNNPAKAYPTRHMPDGSVTTSTLIESGNNPGKRYSTSHMPATAVREQTLLTNGNNPARKATVTASTP